MNKKILAVSTKVIPILLAGLMIPLWKTPLGTSLSWGIIIVVIILFLLEVYFLFMLQEIIGYKNKNKWLLPKKKDDGRSLPFVFLSIDVINHSKYYSTDLKSIDAHLDTIFDIVKKKISNEKKNLWYKIGDTALYGFLDNRPDVNIPDKILNLTNDLINEIDGKFTIKGEVLQIRILLHRVSEIIYRDKPENRKGLAVNIIRKTKVPGDNTSLSVTSSFYQKLINEDLKSQFHELDFKLFDKKIYGNIPFLKKSYLKKIDKHSEKRQFVFAADFAMKLLNITGKSEINILTKILSTINDIENDKVSLFPKRALKKIYSLKLEKHKGNQLKFTDDENNLLNVYEARIEKGIHFTMKNLKEGYSTKRFLLSIGKSPENQNLKKHLKKLKEDVTKKSKEGTLFHNNCTLCTASVGTIMALLGEEKELNKILSWLFDNRQRFFDGCKMQAGKDRNWHYTAAVLKLLILIGNVEKAQVLINLLLKEETNWLKGRRESHSIEIVDSIFSSLIYFAEVNSDLWSKNHEIDASKKAKFHNEIIKQMERISTLEKIDDKELSEFVLKGFRSISMIYKSNMDLDEIVSDSNYDNLESLFSKNKIEEYHNYIITSTLWDGETGSWGFVADKTKDYIELWFDYWEMKLAIQERGIY